MKQCKKGGKWWACVGFSVGLFLTPAPVPGGEAKLNFSGAQLFNVNVTQVTNNVTVTNTTLAQPSSKPPKPVQKVNKATSKGSCVR